AQTFTDFELILVDDGSPDNCPAICDAYAENDSRVNIIHKTNGGVSAARNCGLDMACGEYIAFCDSDDYWAPSFLDRLVHTLVSENADCVVSNYATIDESGQLIRQSYFSETTEYLTKPEERLQYLLQDIMGGKTGWEVWTRLFRSEIIQTHKIRFCTTCSNYAEDLGFTLEYSLYAKKICCVSYCGYNYVIHDGSMMNRSKNEVKLSQLNEVSAQFGEKYETVFSGSEYRKVYPLFHFLIMYTEYRKMVGNDFYSTISKEIQKIENKKWNRKQTKDLFKCKKYLVFFYGKRIAQQMLLFSHYCLHGNWKRFDIESAIAYRWFIDKE
ncbi:MAG: glycosyltransferase family 2 protein, partial [Lachnospiraceae bacterium]